MTDSNRASRHVRKVPRTTVCHATNLLGLMTRDRLGKLARANCRVALRLRFRRRVSGSLRRQIYLRRSSELRRDRRCDFGVGGGGVVEAVPLIEVFGSFFWVI